MFKKLLPIVLSCFMCVAYACEHALPTDNPQFCASFKAVAICHCTNSGLPAKMCQDVRALYRRMMVVYSTLENACQNQKHTSYQDCLDSWRCYLGGGQDSQGLLCSGTGNPCE